MVVRDNAVDVLARGRLGNNSAPMPPRASSAPLIDIGVASPAALACQPLTRVPKAKAADPAARNQPYSKRHSVPRPLPCAAVAASASEMGAIGPRAAACIRTIASKAAILR